MQHGLACVPPGNAEVECTAAGILIVPQWKRAKVIVCINHCIQAQVDRRLAGASPEDPVRARRFAIASTPSVQDGVAKELSEAGLLAHGEDREPRLPAYDDLPNLPYLTSVRFPKPLALGFRS